MIYSYTQISQYLACPRRYRHRYLDGWKEKDARAAMLFGRGFERALAAYFLRQDAAAALFREWKLYQDQKLEYSHGDTWDRMLEQGIQLLDRFCQDDRVRIRQPRRNLQIKFVRPLSGQNEFVAYIDAIGRAGRLRLFARMEDHFEPLSGRARWIVSLRPAAGLLLLDHWRFRSRTSSFRAQAPGRDPVPAHRDHR